MIITERDIFNFVNYPEKLDREKADYIRSRRALFKEQIGYCEEEKREIDERVQNGMKVFHLMRVPYIEKKKEPVYYLAADSINLDKTIRTETYVSEGERYYIKAVFYSDKTKIFVFGGNETRIKNFKLMIKPSEKTYIMESNDAPLELPAEVHIDSIRLEL